MIDAHHGWNVSFKPAVLGFVLSLILLFASYRIVTHHHLETWITYALVVSLAISQAILQLVFFMHLGLESKPYWNLLMFFFAVFVMIILVGGSMWIMHNLSHNLMYQDGYSLQ